MIIKKFQGKTEAEALSHAKAELGQSVVVMNVKNVRRKGFFSLFRPAPVEVTVALEEESEHAGSFSHSSHPETAPAGEEGAAGASGRTQPGVGIGEAFTAALKKEGAAPARGRGAIANSPDILPEPDPEEEKELKAEKAIEEKLESLHLLLEQQLTRESEEARGEKEGAEEKPSQLELFIKMIYNTLLDNEVSEKYANQFLEEMEKLNKPGAGIDYLLANVYQKMILKFGLPSPITPAARGPKMVFFIGPTGVGKTTTIAKIASSFSVNEKRKVVLLTTDTYRIAAAEQLKTYANILDVPFRIVYSTDEIETALRDFSNYDYILVDTAGHSHQNESQRENMSRYLSCAAQKAETEVFLVVSATTKYRDLVNIADTYSDICTYKLIFTKLDETTTLGSILNLKLYTGADLSYVTYGQNVPDDIAQFNPQSTVKQLLGGR